MKGLELVLEKRRLCGDLSPASALAILQKTPPDAVGIHDQTHAIASINSPLRHHELFGTQPRKGAGEFRRSPVGTEKQLMHQRSLQKQGVDDVKST